MHYAAVAPTKLGTGRRDYHEAKHLIYDIRNGHIEVEEEAPTEDAAAHDRTRKAEHDT